MVDKPNDESTTDRPNKPGEGKLEDAELGDAELGDGEFGELAARLDRLWPEVMAPALAESTLVESPVAGSTAA